MASEPPPGTPRPDQTPPPAGSHARPASLPPSSDWLAPPDDSPADQLPDDVLFDELIAEAEPVSGPPSGLIDLNSVEAGSDRTMAADPGESGSIFARRSADPDTEPPPTPTGPATDWLDSPSAIESDRRPPTLDLGAPTSDVILGQHRDSSEDALGGDGVRNASSSSIFEAPPPGSSRFDNPIDPTEPVPDLASLVAPPPSDVIGGLADTGSSGHLFGDVNPLDLPDAVAGADPLQDSSESSGITSSDSSIFGNLPSPDSNLGAADLLAEVGPEVDLDEDIHVPPEQLKQSSHIFMTNEGPVLAEDEGQVSFALPPPGAEHSTSGPTSGLIDWGTSGSGAKLTDHLTEEEAAAAGVPDLAELARQADTPRPAATPGPARRGQSEPGAPKSVKAAKPTTAKGGAVGWLGGTAVGLFLGVALSAGAYFAGLVPSPEAKSAQAPEADALRRQLADASRLAEEARGEAELAKADREKTTNDLASTQRALLTAQRTAQAMTSANDKAALDLTNVRKTLDDTQKMLTAARAETEKAVAKAREDGKKALTDQGLLLDAAKKDLDAKTAMVTAAEKRTSEAMTRQKAAEESLANVVKELKTVKLIDEKDDAAAALAKLPDVLKKAGAAAQSADVQRAAAALLAANKETEAARAELKAAEAMVAKVRADAQTAIDQANRKAAANFEIIQQKDIELADTRAKAQSDLAKALAAKEEEHRSQLAAARAGVLVPLSSGELAAKERATEAFNEGVEAYFAGRYAAAEAAFVRATQLDGTDARPWYFLGLTRFQSGTGNATEAFKQGGELEARNQPSAKTVTVSLERVQGPARQALNRHRP